MDRLIRDLKIAARSLAKRPGFTFVIVLLLALGIGANVTIFSVLDAAFLRGVPVADPERVVAVYVTDANYPGLLPISYKNYEDLRDQNQVLEGLAAFQWLRPNYLSESHPERIHAQVVSPNYFPVLGVRPALGRLFLPSDFSGGGEPIIVLNHSFWQRYLGADPQIVGQPLTLNGQKFTVVGVAERQFRGTSTFIGPDLWFPVSVYKQVSPFGSYIDERQWQMFDMVGRLKPGVGAARANTAIKSIADRLAIEYPDSNRGQSATVLPLAQASVPPEQREVYVRAGALLMIVVGLLLFIVCANVASLILTRSLGRRQEVAVRVALGAGRRQLLQQLMVESSLLTLIGAALGIVLALWGPDLLWRLHPPFFMGWTMDFGLDGRALAFAVGVALLCGILVGLAPALQASRPDLVTAIKAQTAGSGQQRRHGALRSGLVVLQIALSVIGLIGAGLFLRSLEGASRIDPGFDTKNVIVLNFDLSAQGYDAVRGEQFHRRLEERLASVPGIRSAAVGDNRPMMPGAVYHTILVDGDTSAEAAHGYTIRSDTVAHDYFETLGIPLLEGRPFSSADRPGSPLVAIVNSTMAKRFWPQGNALGKRFRVRLPEQEMAFEVIGVVGDSNYTVLGEPPVASFFAHLDQLQTYLADVCLFVRTDGPPEQLLERVRSEVQALDPTLPLSHLYTMSQVLGSSLWGHRMGATLLGVFAVLALFLAATGIYGAMAYTVGERQREIGIRMALGAQKGDVLRLILTRALAIVVTGLALGFFVSFVGGRLLSNLLYGIAPTDLLTYLGVGVVLPTIALLASYLAARKGTVIPPGIALRTD